MKSKGILTIALSVLGSSFVLGQGQAPPLPPAPANPPTPSLQATNDPGYAAVIAKCQTPPPAQGARGGGGARGGAGAGAAPPQLPRDHTVTEIPRVIAAGQRWKFVWQEAGNNGDGIVGTNNGRLLIAQNDNSQAVKLDQDGKTSVAYSGTRTGGALSMSSKGAVFVAERGLHASIVELAPQHKVLADSYQGDPLDCIGGPERRGHQVWRESRHQRDHPQPE
jgi:hypothetical protein